MSTRLESDIQETKTTCPYASNCPLLTPNFKGGSEDAEERYALICSTDRKYGCSQFVQMGARE